MAACVAAQSAATRFDGIDGLGIAVDRLGVEQIERVEDIVVEPGFSIFVKIREKKRSTQSIDSYKRLLECPGACDNTECVDLA